MASESASGSVNVGASSTSKDLEVVRIIPTTRNQEVWQHFDLCEMSDGSRKARCKHCNKIYKHDSNTTLGSHITKPFCKVLKAQPRDGQTSMKNEGTLWAYDVNLVREEFGNFVIKRSLPFNHFDDPEFTRVIQRTLQPRYTHVSRSTLRRDCLKRWKQAKRHLIDYFGNLKTGVNLTSDVWSAPHGSPESYICVTAHWVEPESWQMMKRTIAFRLFDYPHTGENIFAVIDRVIQTFKLEDKILSISFDNASNNTSAVTLLKMKYKPVCDGVFVHSRCVAHIINLAVQDGIKVIEPQKENFKRMLREIYSNVQTHSKYIKFCKTSNSKYLGPYWDIATRWNSTCLMFEKAIEQKESLIGFHNLLASKGKVLAFHPSKWDVIETITQVLQVFKNATTALSGVYYPTSPITLNKIYLMTRKLGELECRGRPYSDMVGPMKEKLRKYFAEIPPVFTCAAALNPCLNKKGVENLIDKIANELNLNTKDDPFFSQGLKSRFNKNFSSLFDIYLAKYGQTSHIHQTLRNSVFETDDPDLDLYNDLFVESSNEQRSEIPSSELGMYFGTNFILSMTSQEFKNFDILAWWKGKEPQFPVLAAMARDLLTVQASTVASESAFSTSGRVITIRRTWLSPPAVEMSICLKDHLDAAERAQDTRSLEGELDYEAQLYDEEVEDGFSTGMTDEEAAYDEYLRNSSGSGEE